MHTAYISGVSVREEYRKQNMGNNLMSQAHFRLYHKDVVFASLIPAEEWLYDWYSRCGYTRNITCTLPPADVENMDFSTSIGGNVQRIAYFYMTKKVLILSRKIIVYHSLLSQMLA